MAICFDLTGKRALVTGANTGIGQAIAVALAGAGADIALAGRSEPGETLALIAATGRIAVDLRADLSTIAPVQGIVDQAVAALGGLDILVNNAGIIRRNDLADFSEEDWDAVIDTNLKTLFFLSQAAAKVMMAQGSGKIINIASLLSFQGGIRVPSYAAAKSGVAGLTKALANELAPKGVQVNAIAQNFVDNPTYFPAEVQANPRFQERLAREVPLGRLVAAREDAQFAAYLCSAAADCFVGQVFPVCGGWVAR